MHAVSQGLHVLDESECSFRYEVNLVSEIYQLSKFCFKGSRSPQTLRPEADFQGSEGELRPVDSQVCFFALKYVVSHSFQIFD